MAPSLIKLLSEEQIRDEKLKSMGYIPILIRNDFTLAIEDDEDKLSSCLDDIIFVTEDYPSIEENIDQESSKIKNIKIAIPALYEVMNSEVFAEQWIERTCYFEDFLKENGENSNSDNNYFNPNEDDDEDCIEEQSDVYEDLSEDREVTYDIKHQNVAAENLVTTTVQKNTEENQQQNTQRYEEDLNHMNEQLNNVLEALSNLSSLVSKEVNGVNNKIDGIDDLLAKQTETIKSSLNNALTTSTSQIAGKEMKQVSDEELDKFLEDITLYDSTMFKKALVSTVEDFVNGAEELSEEELKMLVKLFKNTYSKLKGLYC